MFTKWKGLWRHLRRHSSGGGAWFSGTITDRGWALLEPLLPHQRSIDKGHPYKAHRQVINGMLWILHTGASSVQEVWEHWLSVSGRERSKLTPERRRVINSRLRTYSVEELKQAIDGAHRNPFYLGENDRSTYYGNIETIFKNDSSVEKHLEYAGSPPAEHEPTERTWFDPEKHFAEQRRQREAYEAGQAAYRAWQSAVLERFAGEPMDVQESWRGRITEETAYLTSVSAEMRARMTKYELCMRYGAAIGLTREAFGAAA